MNYANQESFESFKLNNEPEHVFSERIRTRALASLDQDCDNSLLIMSQIELLQIKEAYEAVEQVPHQANYFLEAQYKTHGQVVL